MQLINLETKQVITRSEFKGLFPNTSLPSNINYLDYGYAVVFPAPQPDHNQVIEYCKEIAPVLTSKGTWEQQWEIQKRFQEYTDEEGVVHTVEEQEQEALAKDAEVKAQQSLLAAKAKRQSEVDALVVTTSSGKVFDGDEADQTRMARAILALNPEESTLWVLADNTPVLVLREELQEALRLAGAAQTAIWIKPYEVPTT